MKKSTLLKNIRSVVSQPSQGARKRLPRRAISSLQFASLEPRNLLATVSWTSGATTFDFVAEPGEADVVEVQAVTADTFTIVVGNGDSISLAGNAIGSANFNLSTTVNPDDTLTVDTTFLSIAQFEANLGDMDDSILVLSNPASFSGIGFDISGGAGNDIIDASGSSVQTAIGGNEGDDTITGGSASDFILGGEGTDTVDGGGGLDANKFDDLTVGIVAKIDASGMGTATYGAVTETFVNIERLWGTNHDDTLVALGNSDIELLGFDGDDILASDGGNDTLIGGPGIDTVTFEDLTTGVIASIDELGNGSATHGVFTANLFGVENLTGSNFDDELIATGMADNILNGLGGDDRLNGGDGVDMIDGGDGTDTNSFVGFGSGVTAVINNDGTGSSSSGLVIETFANIENLVGSAHADNLTGDDSANEIDGGLGDDMISGLGGDDFLIGSSGDDTINGGAGNDRIVGGFGDDNLNGDGGDDYLLGNGQMEITFTNLSPTMGGLLTPVFVATQDGVYDQFDAGSSASDNIERLAEDGNTGPRVAAALGSGGVHEALTTPGGPIAPGEFRSLTFFADPSDPLTQYVSYASMVIPSNDAFIGNDDPTQLDLFDDAGNLIHRTGSSSFIVAGADVWDAGTEVNDEIPMNTPVLGQMAPNTGVTEGGLIGPHPGFIPGGNILTAFPGADFTMPGRNVMSIEVNSTREEGFSLGLNGQPLQSLTTAQTPAELVTEAANNNLYFNVHTNSFAAGEIRGQLILVSDDTVSGVRTLVLTASLDGAQETVATNSPATGVGTMTIVDDGTSISYSSTLEIQGILKSDLLPVAGVSAIHIHNAPAGINGGVITDVVQGAGGDVDGNTTDPAADTGDGDVFQEAMATDNDVMNGGDGNDMLRGSGGDDILRGSGGNDTIYGGEGNDSHNGGDGDDMMVGGGGDDFFVDIAGTDTIDGGTGVDTNSFQVISESVTAVINADGTGTAAYGTVTETFMGIENLTGSTSDDVLTAFGAGDNVLRGLAGNDDLSGGGGDDLLVGNSGDDHLYGAGGNDIAIGGDGNDSLNGGDGDDNLRGVGGDDYMAGGNGTDMINGGAGNDVNAFRGVDTGVTARLNDMGSGVAQHGFVNESFFGIESLVGSDNNDVLMATGMIGRRMRGFGGNDLIIGGSGNDTLSGDDGDDIIRGKAGNDLIFGNLGNDQLFADAGDDFARGDEGDDTIFGGTGMDRLSGKEGDDSLFGQEDVDLIFGGLGDDGVFGNEGDDDLRGGDGDDILIGGLGIDDLLGGPGNDQEIQ